MKSVNNAIIEDSDAIYMAQLNGHGGIMPITANSIASNERPFGFISIIVNPKSDQWINQTGLLPPIAKDVAFS